MSAGDCRRETIKYLLQLLHIAAEIHTGDGYIILCPDAMCASSIATMRVFTLELLQQSNI